MKKNWIKRSWAWLFHRTDPIPEPVVKRSHHAKPPRFAERLVKLAKPRSHHKKEE